MKYTDFDRITCEYGLGRNKGYNGFILTFKNVVIGNIHLAKKINRSMLWLSCNGSYGHGEILNHIKEEDLRERLENKIKRIKENIQRERIKNLDKDF